MSGSNSGTLERGRGLSLWRQIAGEITGDIQSGVLSAGDRLPPERVIAEKYQVNRHTIRRSMAALAEEGLIRIEHGRGTFVQDVVLDYRVGARTRFSEIVSRQNRTPHGRILRSETVRVSAAIARMLGDARRTRCLFLETLSEADGRPISIGTHYFPLPRFEALAALYEETGSITKALAQLGVKDYTRTKTRVMARLPEGDEAELLKQPRNRPVLVTEALNVDGDSKPIEYGIARFASDRVQIVVET